MATAGQVDRSIVPPVLDWYLQHRRDLPWRRPDATPWAILVSEVMLQQTPVGRVVPVYAAWLERWPAPADLAADKPADAIRMWGRLGYPRRARRLYEAAALIVAQHGGVVPAAYEDLRALPGIGDYTAAAVASFAFGQRHAVLDTNARRMLARALVGAGDAGGGGPSAAERRLAASVVPADPPTAAGWAVASMELGALICTARAPRCSHCPIADICAWRLAGQPPPRRRRGQRYDGTDRQARGRLLGLLRHATRPVSAAGLAAAWPDEEQRVRALGGLVSDGLAETLPGELYQLPTERS